MKFNKLWALCVEKDIVPSLMFKELGLSSQTMFSMRPAKEGVEYKTRQKKGSVSLSTINKICGYLKCQPCDIMELGE